MSAEVPQTENCNLIAADPSQIAVGDEVIVTDDHEHTIQGAVTEVNIQAGRYAIVVSDDDGEHTCWERTGRSFTKVEPPA